MFHLVQHACVHLRQRTTHSLVFSRRHFTSSRPSSLDSLVPLADTMFLLQMRYVRGAGALTPHTVVPKRDIGLLVIYVTYGLFVLCVTYPIPDPVPSSSI